MAARTRRTCWSTFARTYGGAPLIDAGPWGTPVRIDMLSDPLVREDDPTLTADLLEIYSRPPPP